MVAKRDSIIRIARQLCDEVLESGMSSAKEIDLAQKLKRLCDNRGRYQKKYEDPEERVLMRHLSLYKNKLAYSKQDKAKERWRKKLREQEEKIADWRAQKSGGRTGLDLDGL